MHNSSITAPTGWPINNKKTTAALTQTREQVPKSANRTSAGAQAAGARAGGARHDPREVGGTKASMDNSGSSAFSDDRSDTPVEGFICPDCRERFYAADALVAHFGSAHTDAGRGAGGNNRFGGGGGGDNDDARGGALVEPQAAATGWGGENTRIQGDGGGCVSGSSSVAATGPSLKDQLFGTRAGGIQADSAAAAAGGGRGGGGVIAEQKAVMASQDAYLDSVGQAVKELGLLGRNIGASLDGQGATLDRVAEKTSESNDRAAFVTRKAARQAQSSKPKKPTFVMSVALQVRHRMKMRMGMRFGVYRGRRARRRGREGDRERERERGRGRW